MPSHDEAPHPRKKAKKPTIAQLNAQQQTQIQGLQEQLAGITQALTTLTQAQAAQRLLPLSQIPAPTPTPVYASQQQPPMQGQYGYPGGAAHAQPPSQLPYYVAPPTINDFNAMPPQGAQAQAQAQGWYTGQGAQAQGWHIG